jgi:hypothetical protein
MPRGPAPQQGFNHPRASIAPASDRSIRTISGCCRAILAFYGIDPEAIAGSIPGTLSSGELRIGEVSDTADHLAMTLLLPMPYGSERMIVSTIGPPCLTLPGMSLSPIIAATAVRQPIGRLTGHLAFTDLDHLLVTSVEAVWNGQGRPATILHFDDPAEPLVSVCRGVGSRSVH